MNINLNFGDFEKGSMSRGLVGDSSNYLVLPTIQPIHTFLITLLAFLVQKKNNNLIFNLSFIFSNSHSYGEFGRVQKN